MKIADLFINLGVKGSEAAVSTFGKINDGVKEIGASSLATKAAILGVVYGLEQMMSASAKNGMELQQFANLTGISTDVLQRWQYMARQSGVSADEMSSSFKNVQAAMDKMNTGQGAPKGIEAIARSLQKTGSGLDINRAVKDTVYMMDKLREYAATTQDSPARANDWLNSFGLGEGTIQMMRTNKMKMENIKPDQIYSKGEIGQLGQVEVAWSNLGKKVEMAFGHLTSKHGLSIVQDISKVTESVFHLADAFIKLAESLKVFKLLAMAAEGLSMIFDPTRKDGLAGIANQLDKGNLTGGGATVTDINKKNRAETMGDILNSDVDNGPPVSAPAVRGIPSIPAPAGKTEINQTLNFQHEGKDHKKTGDSVKQAVKDAHRQFAAQRQGS